MNAIVVGCGRVGAQLATLLSEAGHNVSVIDHYPEAFQQLGRAFDGQTLKGVGFDEDILAEAGAEDCDVLAAVTNNDNTNLMTAEVARRIFGVEHVIARLFDTKREKTYTQLGIDFSCGTSLVTEDIFTKIQSRHGHHVDSFGDFELLHFTLNLPDGKSVPCAQFEQAHDMRVVSYEHEDQSYLPGEASILADGDFVLGCIARDRLDDLAPFMKG